MSGTCRELLFPLPALSARQAILDIHTRQWAEPPPPELKVELANMCVGYCGADLKVRALRQHVAASGSKLSLLSKQAMLGAMYCSMGNWVIF